MFPLGRRVVRKLAPAPGEGPSREDRDGGFYRFRMLAEAADGRRAMGIVAEPNGDPGNRSTVKMMCESALCLVHSRAQLPGGSERGGVLTPATGLGQVLVDRLRAAGMTLTVEPYTPGD